MTSRTARRFLAIPLFMAHVGCGPPSGAPRVLQPGQPHGIAGVDDQPDAAIAPATSALPLAAGGPAPSSAVVAQVTPPATSPPPLPALPNDGRILLSAPPLFQHLVIKVGFPPASQFRNLYYEGHNGLLHKGAVDARQIAERWRSLVRGTRGVFVLRDSLFSQQDYVYGFAPHALMLPPNWISTAVADVALGQPLRLPQSPALDDDAAWTALHDPAAMFGSFPASEGLHRRASRTLATGTAEEQRQTRASRASIHALSEHARALVTAAAQGPEAVAAAGAERIARSDVAYFGASLRYHRVIPILVENPNRREMISEGKGLELPDRQLPAKWVRVARNAILKRRLRDGDIAIERYDLSQPTEQQRAIAMLRDLLPVKTTPAAPGRLPKIWLWVSGKLERSGRKGEGAGRYLPGFLKRLAAEAVDHSRLEVLSVPAFELPAGAAGETAFFGEAKWFRMRKLPMAAALTTSQLRALLSRQP